ncbi:hypothetical protein Poli38472_008036 [Pythium oligandrum]|uniref:Uncharacterized protein n=1 Tax=Pythium oligandrum TaxID=41045 RepID=A0A8K1CKV6_PYTOL|nr:hypothetical protein Poli38472_008036 [Pythium oligandrum]|eukprot:TMW65394.1 hypothetical protein Poli38472_008036 [Pythium oligandrum]
MATRFKALFSASTGNKDVENRVPSVVTSCLDKQLSRPNDSWVSSLTFVGVWLCVLAVHALCCIYFFFVWWFYRILPEAILTRYLKLYNLGIANSEYGLISIAHVFFFGLHASSGSVMVLWSLRKRRCSFGPWPFHELRGLKFYNSTITKWTKDAELTQEAHPNLLTTLFVRTNFTNREIPRGFLSDNFPQRLMDVEFSVTNLRVLPDDVDTKWHKGGTYHFEYSQFDAIPPSILRLQPRQLSFVGNRLTRFPFEVLNVHGLFYLILSSNPISSLSTSPYQHFVDKSSLSRILLSHTNISSLPRWLDQFFLRKVGPRAPLIVVETPMCTGLAAAKSLRSQADDLGVPEDERSLVMNKAAAEVPGFMSCSIPAVAYYYPLSYEDTWNGIAQKG